MQLPPLDVIESWPKPNYIDPVLRGPENIIVNSVLFPLVLLVVGIRIYTRLRISRSFGLDDWLLVSAVFPTTGCTIANLLAEMRYGFDRHIWDIHLDEITMALKMVIVTQVLFGIATTLTKASMLVLIYRIVEAGSSRLAKFIIGVLVIASAQGILFCFVVVFQCGKPSEYWTLSIAPQPECISETNHLLAAGIINTITDLLVVVLPIPIVCRLQLPRQQVIGVVMLFAAGLLVTISGAVRTLYIYRTTTSWDRSWHAFPGFICATVELDVAIICASLPPTKKFFSLYGPRWLSSMTVLQRKPPSWIINTFPTNSHHSHPENDIERMRFSELDSHESKSTSASNSSKTLNYFADTADWELGQRPASRGSNSLRRVDTLGKVESIDPFIGQAY